MLRKMFFLFMGAVCILYGTIVMFTGIGYKHGLPVPRFTGAFWVIIGIITVAFEI